MPVSASTPRYGRVTIKNLILWIFVLGAIGIAGYALFVALSNSKDAEDKSSEADVQKAIQKALQDYVQTTTLDDTLNDYVKTTTLNDYVKTDDDDYVKTNDAIYIVGTTKCNTTQSCGIDKGSEECTAQLSCASALPLIGGNNIQAVFQEAGGSSRHLKIVKPPPPESAT